jgi:hypothetical protein
MGNPVKAGKDGWPDIVAARSDAPNAIWFSTKPGGGR